MNKVHKSILGITMAVMLSLSIYIGYLSLFHSNDSIVSDLEPFSNVILAGLTLMYVYLTYLILVSNEKSIIQQNRPFIITSLPLYKSIFKIKLENIGSRPAKNIEVKIKPSLKSLFPSLKDRDSYKNLLTQKFMEPSFIVEDVLGSAQELFQNNAKNRKVDIKISYNDMERNHYKHTYEIDINDYVYEGIRSVQENNDDIKEIRKSLQGIEKSLESRS